jgi:MFS family permease
MSACITCPGEQPRAVLSNRTTVVMAVITAMTFSASGAAPTPLYQHYQEIFGLTPVALTIVFAAYVQSLLLALITVGSVSDYVGRRAAILAALALNVAAVVMFTTANGVFVLTVARSIQGFATGLATATLAATILDIDRSRAPVLNSVTPFGGLTLGSLGAGLLVTYAPDPRQLVYFILLLLSAIEALVFWYMPETAARKSGALSSVLPHVNVPKQARAALAQVTPVTIASWALGGFYFSLMPSLVRVATGAASPIVGGLVVSALTLAGALSVLSLRALCASRLLGIGIAALVLGVLVTLAGVHTQLLSLLLIGTVVSGAGFGAALSCAGSCRSPAQMSAPGCSRRSISKATSRSVCPPC